MAPEVDLIIQRGKTFEHVMLYGGSDPVQVSITAMPSKIPLRLSVPGHGLVDGWPVWVLCVKAPADINSSSSTDVAEVIQSEPYRARVIDADTIELPWVIAANWAAYSGPGVLLAFPPEDLTGWVCRAQVRDKIGGAVLFDWHSDPAQAPDGLIELSGSKITLTMDDATAAALSWKRAVWDAELVSPAGKVVPLVALSQITVEGEVTA